MSSLRMSDPTDRLRAALAAEHAALYAYGRLGILLDTPGKAAAHDAETAHRGRRDALVVHLDQVKASPVAAQAGYALPFPLSDRASAVRLAAQVEESVAATWRGALAPAQGEIRKMVLDAYTDAAVRAVRWRKSAGITPLTSQFPGRSG